MSDFPENMTVGDWEGLLGLAEERVALAWIEKHGYVKLDGIDVEALRDEMKYATPHARMHSPVVRLAAAYLAALDQEDTDGNN